MDFNLSEEQTAVRDLARDFAEQEIFPAASHDVRWGWPGPPGRQR